MVGDRQATPRASLHLPAGARALSFYDLHGFIGIRVETDVTGYRRYFDNEYSRISASSAGVSPPRTTVTVRIVDTLPPTEAGDLRGSTRFKRLFRFSWAVRGLDTDDVQLFFERHAVDRLYVTAVGVFLQAQLLEPVLYHKLLEQGALLMHAAAVAHNGAACLFPAHGGTGKTTLSLRMARRGFELLGDDLVLVDPQSGRVFPHQRPLHLFSYNLRQMRDTKVPWRLRAVIRFKDAVRVVLETLLREEFLISTRAHVQDVLPTVRFSAAVPYRRLVFLTGKHPAGREKLDTLAARDSVAATIAASADLNGSLRTHILSAGSHVEASVAREHEVVRALLARLEEVEFLDPRALSDAEFEAFVNRVLP